MKMMPYVDILFGNESVSKIRVSHWPRVLQACVQVKSCISIKFKQAIFINLLILEMIVILRASGKTYFDKIITTGTFSL